MLCTLVVSTFKTLLLVKKNFRKYNDKMKKYDALQLKRLPFDLNIINKKINILSRGAIFETCH